MTAGELLPVFIEEVVKRYGRRTVVDRVSLALHPGERLALLGHNGAGKSTLMKMMLGVVRRDAGGLRVLGRDPSDAAAAVRAGVGFLPENVVFHDAMTGWEVIRFYARLKRRPHRESKAMIERVGLEDAADRRVATYSKGMRQRLGLAQALLGHPRLLLLDEPTVGLDPQLRQAFYDIISELSDHGTAVMLSSHLLTELEERTDRIAIMDRGRLVAAGTLDELRRRADLPVRIRLRVPPGAAAAVAQQLRTEEAQVAGPDAVAFDCRPEEKMAALRRVAALGETVKDFDMSLPDLDDVYASFVGYRLGSGQGETL